MQIDIDVLVHAANKCEQRTVAPGGRYWSVELKPQGLMISATFLIDGRKLNHRRMIGWVVLGNAKAAKELITQEVVRMEYALEHGEVK